MADKGIEAVFVASGAGEGKVSDIKLQQNFARSITRWDFASRFTFGDDMVAADVVS